MTMVTVILAVVITWKYCITRINIVQYQVLLHKEKGHDLHSQTIYRYHLRIVKHTGIWVIEQAWGQDGRILAKFFFCVVVDRLWTQKKNEANILPSWPNKLGQ